MGVPSRIYNAFTRAIAGLVPAPGGSGTSRFLREDGSWVTATAIPTPAIVYVASNGNDSTGLRGQSALPFLTLNGAAAVAQSGDTIRVGIGTFAPMTTALAAYVPIYGSGKPTVDSETNPTKLVGGTIIQGPFPSGGEAAAVSGMQLYDLGVDTGSAVCTALYSGVAQSAIDITNVNSSHPIGVPRLRDIRVRNVVALTNSAISAVHAALIENVERADVRDLETWYSLYGLVIKLEWSLFGCRWIRDRYYCLLGYGSC
jgi:hypothetical protein